MKLLAKDFSTRQGLEKKIASKVELTPVAKTDTLEETREDLARLGLFRPHDILGNHLSDNRRPYFNQTEPSQAGTRRNPRIRH
jgi:hypothetical protein